MPLQFQMATQWSCIVTYFLMASIIAINIGMSIATNLPDCNQNNPLGWIRHPTDCGRYYKCNRGKRTEMSPCPLGMVFSIFAESCVKSESPMNDCRKRPVRETLEEVQNVEKQCRQNSSAIFPHPSHCQLYYNCSKTQEVQYPSYFRKYVEECPYYKVFNANTSLCDDHANVKCGDRAVHQSPCEYMRSQCPVPHCIPCSSRFSSCVGLGNGMKPFHGKEWSPYYAVCAFDRTLGYGVCVKNNTFDADQLFSPVRGNCVSLFDIPKEHGGYYPNCTERSDGFYTDDVRNDIYFQCVNKKMAVFEQCASDSIFNLTSSSCVTIISQSRTRT